MEEDKESPLLRQPVIRKHKQESPTKKIDYSKYLCFSQTEKPQVRQMMLQLMEAAGSVKTIVGSCSAASKTITKQINEDLQTKISSIERLILENMSKYITIEDRLAQKLIENVELVKELNKQKERNENMRKEYKKMREQDINLVKTEIEKLKMTQSEIIEDRRKIVEELREEIKNAGKHDFEQRDKVRKREISIERSKKERELYSIVLKGKGEQKEIKDMIKQERKRDNMDINIEDIVETKDKRIIMRAMDKSNLDKMKIWIEGNPSLRDKVDCSLPNKRMEKIIVLGLSSDTDEETTKLEIENQMEGEVDEVMVEIIKMTERKDGLKNCIVNVDSNTKRKLLERGRICIDMTRVRINEFISVVRCFKCQGFGHTSTNCRKENVCAICAGNHDSRTCKDVDEKCVNCNDGENKHRADSNLCPSYVKYKRSCIAKRL